MRLGSFLFTALVFAIATAASGQIPTPAAQRGDAYRAQVKKFMEVEKRAWELRPRRRDEPLREINISDNEVREIQRVAADFLPKVLLNISPVVAGCACEEGPQCTDQVYIVAETGQTSKGLQLSRIKNSWTVGNVQQWWFKYDELNTKANKKDYLAYIEALNALYREFPGCVGELVPAVNTTASASKDMSKDASKVESAK